MTEKILTGVAALLLLFVIGAIGYRELGTSRLTVTVKLKKGEDPFSVMRQLLPSDSSIADVREISKLNNEYELTVDTHKRKKHLLEWLRSSSRVERADFKNDIGVN